MSNKIKSLLYFSCFVASSLIYYQMEQNLKTENTVVITGTNTLDTNEIAEVDLERLENF